MNLEHKFRRAIKIYRYIWQSFHNHIISISCGTTVVIYYLYCIFTSYYVDIDISLGRFLRDSFYYPIDTNSSVRGKSIINLSLVNRSIYENHYMEAINTIDGIKKHLSKSDLLYTYLSIRQALLYVDLYDNESDYIMILESKYPHLSDETIKSLIAMYRLCKEE